MQTSDHQGGKNRRSSVTSEYMGQKHLSGVVCFQSSQNELRWRGRTVCLSKPHHPPITMETFPDRYIDSSQFPRGCQSRDKFGFYQ